jgi:CRP-like cAMP-binding protein
LSEGITLKHFGIGEQVVRQGHISNALYIVVSGQAVMTVTDKTGETQEVLPLKAGEFFGEMTLFSGELSPISVTAVDDLEVMMISAVIVNQMIERQPNFAREISQILELRRRAVHLVNQTGANSQPINF